MHPEERVPFPALRVVHEGAEDEGDEKDHEEEHVEELHARDHRFGEDVDGALGELDEADDSNQAQHPEDHGDGGTGDEVPQRDVVGHDGDEVDDVERVAPELPLRPRATHDPGHELHGEDRDGDRLCDEPLVEGAVLVAVGEGRDGLEDKDQRRDDDCEDDEEHHGAAEVGGQRVVQKVPHSSSEHERPVPEAAALDLRELFVQADAAELVVPGFVPKRLLRLGSAPFALVGTEHLCPVVARQAAWDAREPDLGSILL